MSVAVKPTVIFVLGGPGAGKGTQCEKIVNVSKSVRFRSRYLNHIVTDLYLRDEYINLQSITSRIIQPIKR